MGWGRGAILPDTLRTGYEKVEGQAVIKVDLAQAEHQLSHLIEEAAGGEEVLIARGDGLTFRIVLQDPQPRPRFGSAKGLIRMAEDFDQPLDDFTSVRLEVEQNQLVRESD